MPVEAPGGADRPVTILVDGEPLHARRGEPLAAALLAAGRRVGVFCNMGSCCECRVTLAPAGRRVRACLTPVEDGMVVEIDG